MGVYDTEREAAEKYDEEATAHNKLSILNFSNCSSQYVEQSNYASTTQASADSGTDSCAETINLRRKFDELKIVDRLRKRKIALGKHQTR